MAEDYMYIGGKIKIYLQLPGPIRGLHVIVGVLDPCSIVEGIVIILLI